jgi:hypothetical protein
MRRSSGKTGDIFCPAVIALSVTNDGCRELRILNVSRIILLVPRAQHATLPATRSERVRALKLLPKWKATAPGQPSRCPGEPLPLSRVCNRQVGSDALSTSSILNSPTVYYITSFSSRCLASYPPRFTQTERIIHRYKYHRSSLSRTTTYDRNHPPRRARHTPPFTLLDAESWGFLQNGSLRTTTFKQPT